MYIFYKYIFKKKYKFLALLTSGGIAGVIYYINNIYIYYNNLHNIIIYKGSEDASIGSSRNGSVWPVNRWSVHIYICYTYMCNNYSTHIIIVNAINQAGIQFDITIEMYLYISGNHIRIINIIFLCIIYMDDRYRTEWYGYYRYQQPVAMCV